MYEALEYMPALFIWHLRYYRENQLCNLGLNKPCLIRVTSPSLSHMSTLNIHILCVIPKL